MIMSVHYPRMLFSLWALALLSTKGTLLPVRGDGGFDEQSGIEGPLGRDDSFFADKDEYDDRQGRNREKAMSFLEALKTFVRNVDEGTVDLNDNSVHDVRDGILSGLARLSGNPSLVWNDHTEERQGHKKEIQHRPRILNDDLSEKLQKCRAGRKTCNQDLFALRREKNKANRDLDECVTDLASCNDKADSLEDAKRRARGNFRQCQIRKDQCEADLDACRGTTHRPTSSPSSNLTVTSSSYEIRDCSSYSNVVTVNDAANFCQTTLEENTAYLLAGNVTCNEENGPTLSSNVCLDGQGNTITGDSSSVGIRIPSFAANVIIRNCIVEKFETGIANSGGDAFISNVRLTNKFDGIDNGGNMEIQCSIISENGGGIYSGGNISIAGCLIDSNTAGVYVHNPLGTNVVSCSEILSNRGDGIGIADDHVIIRDSIFANSGYFNVFVDYRGSATLTNVATCNAGRSDIYSLFLASYDELTCDNDKLAPPSLATCTYPCPADSSSLVLPETCPVCPNGVGPYVP